MYKILILENNDFIEKIIKESIKDKLNYEIVRVSDKSEAMNILNREDIDIILLGVCLLKMDGLYFIETIQSSLKTKDLPIILFSDSCQTELVKNINMYNIEKYFVKPINSLEVMETINNIMEKNKILNKFKKSNKFINSLVEFYSCEFIALKLLSVLKVLSYKISMIDEDEIKLKYALEILSVIIKSKSARKTINFCISMGVDLEIINLLENIKNPKTNLEEIIYIIYEFAKAKHKHQKIEDVILKDVNRDLVILIQNIINDNVMVANSILDYEIVWDNFLNIILNENNISFDRANIYFLLCAKISRKYKIISQKELFMKILNNSDNIEYVLYVENSYLNQIDEFFSDNLENGISIKVNEKDKNKLLIISIEKDFKETKKVNNKRVQLLKNSTLSNQTSAKEYIKNLNIDISEDIEELKELEEEWESNILTFNYSNIDLLHKVGHSILKYGDKIENMFYEFEPIGYALTQLGNRILNLKDYSNITKNSKEKLINLIELLKEDLSNWREIVFIEQNTDNVHYLDASLLISCTKVEEIFSTKKLIKESDMELF